MRCLWNAILILALLIAGRCSVATGQPYYFNHYQVENGLSNNSVECNIQDDDGFLWIGTLNGLNRFDGYTFKTFYNVPGDTTSLGSNFIRCLYNDEHGVIWVGTNNGVYTFDKVRERFRLIRNLPKGNSTAVMCDASGFFWFIVDQNVYRLDPLTGRVKGYPMDGASPVATSLAMTPDHTLWVSTGNGSIQKYRPEPDSFSTYSIYGQSSHTLPVYIEKIYPMNDSTFLIGTKNDGVKLFDSKKGQYKDIIKINEEGTGIYVHSFTKRKEGEYWIGTETGIYIYNSQNGAVSHLRREYDDPYSLSDNVIHAFCADREGGLWVGTYLGGLNYQSERFIFFEKFFPRRQSASLNGSAVHEICKDRFGNFWVGTEDGGVDKVNMSTRSFTSFQPGSAKGSIAYHNIHGMLASGNELWIGTFEHGLDVLDIPTGKVIRHYDAGPGERQMKSNFIVTVFQTKAQDLLIGTWDGLFQYNRKTDDFSPLTGFGRHIQALWEDENGVLWCCSQGEGVYRYDPRTGRHTNYRYDPRDTNSLVDNHVNGCFEDSRGNLWFGTEAGLCLHNDRDTTGRFIRYTMKDGLPDNLIFRILEDDQHNLWISTSKGLVCFNPDTKDIRTYKRSDGLLSDQFNYNSSFKDSDGMLYFGSVKGLIGFNPSRFLKNTYVPPVYITGIQINNKAYTVAAMNSPLKESITFTRTIRLPFDQSTVSIDFAALSYTVPEMNEYAYKLGGFDKDWTYLKTNRKAYFTKLPPGHYTFMVKGSNSSGVWNEKQAQLEIDILPPFWASTWAYILYALVFAGVIYVMIRYYVNRAAEMNRRRIELLEREKEREIIHAKFEFFTNIAHEIRTPLTLIKMPLDKLMKRPNQPLEINENLRTMERNTNRLIDLTNQLLDFRKTETDKFGLTFVKTDISELIREIFSNFQPAAEEKKLEFRLELPRLTLQAFVDPEALKKMLNNLINNAIKYAENLVVVRMLPFSSEDNLFSIEIRNDGHLIPYDQKEKIFQPFYRLKATEKQPGTGIGLPLARSLAELHKGVLDLKKPENELNVFLLVLPIHQDQEFVFQGEETVKVISSEAAERRSDPSRPVILFVEDNKEILDFVSRELQCDYIVRRCFDGQQALEIVRHENVQLIISDIMMPVMDGIELCKALKTDLEYSHIPIILLTAKNTMHAKIEGLEVGADAYIEKPFALEHLRAQISNLISNRAKIKEYFASSPLVHIKSMGYSKADKQFLEQLDTLIHENLTNTDIDVDYLARGMNMSRATFHRKVKALSNLTPHELINISRLQKAARLLADGNYKVYEVADLVGYSLASNFARDFHKQFGMTPSEYVNSRKNSSHI